jgi:hypothetical protein
MQPTERPIVFGAPYSVYVRSVRLSAEERASAMSLSQSISSLRRAYGNVPLAVEIGGARAAKLQS